jgi:hypothetical protein
MITHSSLAGPNELFLFISSRASNHVMSGELTSRRGGADQL